MGMLCRIVNALERSAAADEECSRQLFTIAQMQKETMMIVRDQASRGRGSNYQWGTR